MPRVSRWEIEKRKMSQMIGRLYDSLGLFNNRDEVKEFFSEFFTPTEKKMLAKRVTIAMMLLEGYNYEEIRGQIKVGADTIGNIANKLKTGEGFRKIAERLLRAELEYRKELEEREKPRKPRAFGAGLIPGVLTLAEQEALKAAKRRSVRHAIKERVTGER